MNIILLATVFDMDGRVLIDARPDNTEGVTARRVNRVQTLDGGVEFNDHGYAEGDRDLVYTWRTRSAAHNERVARLVRLYPLLRVCAPEGVYLAAPATFTPGVAESTVALLVKDKLA